MCDAVLKWKKCPGSKNYRRPKPRPTPEELERMVQEGLARGRAIDEEYRSKLIRMYGVVPDWVPGGIRR